LTLLLDTTVLIDALRGRRAAERIKNLRDAAQVPWICAVNADEVMRGVRTDEEMPAKLLLRGLRLAALGRADGERAGRWRRDYALQGVALSQSDCLIAAAAVGIDARLATGNPKHFPMPELDVEHWPVGE
jgi:predicted nucleic acid-binding protein